MEQNVITKLLKYRDHWTKSESDRLYIAPTTTCPQTISVDGRRLHGEKALRVWEEWCVGHCENAYIDLSTGAVYSENSKVKARVQYLISQAEAEAKRDEKNAQ